MVMDLGVRHLWNIQQEGLKSDRMLGVVYVDLMGPQAICSANRNLYSVDIIHLSHGLSHSHQKMLSSTHCSNGNLLSNNILICVLAHSALMEVNYSRIRLQHSWPHEEPNSNSQHHTHLHTSAVWNVYTVH
jgi:hypothetical protein